MSPPVHVKHAGRVHKLTNEQLVEEFLECHLEWSQGSRNDWQAVERREEECKGELLRRLKGGQ